ncbi:MAG: hypothetical protein AD073_000112 [Mycoplasmataceae bacterium]|nr:MAG: hypothetical protein AD073_000112 [Mycoplasmataceae bacterium]
MLPKLIEYNQTFGVIKEKDEWLISERENPKGAPIFDFDSNKESWCSIEESKKKDWLILFYKRKFENKTSYYKSFAKLEKNKSVFFFRKFDELERSSSGLWIKKSNEVEIEIKKD